MSNQRLLSVTITPEELAINPDCHCKNIHQSIQIIKNIMLSINKLKTKILKIFKYQQQAKASSFIHMELLP